MANATAELQRIEQELAAIIGENDLSELKRILGKNWPAHDEA